MPDPVASNSVQNLGGRNTFHMPLLSLPNNGKTSIFLQGDFDNTTADTVFLLNNVQQYGISMADINASTGTALTNNTSFVWYDNVDLALYQIYEDASSNLSLIKIDNDGTITNIGTDTNANYGFVVIQTNNNATQTMERAAMGSGDFTVTYVEEASAGVRETVQVSSSTGLASGNQPFILSGAVLTPAAAITYITADKTAGIGIWGTSFLRADGYAVVDRTRMKVTAQDNTNPSFPKWLYWDGKVVLSQGVENNLSGATTMGPRVFERVDFDKWVQDVCDYLALPV